MNKEIKTKWLNALESGKYKKGVQQLKDGDYYCCLGVLCALYKEEHEAEWEGDVFKVKPKKSTLLPPIKVVKWAGLQNENPEIEHDECNFIAELNDNREDFEEVIQVIREQF